LYFGLQIAGGDARGTKEISAIVVRASRPRFNVAAIKDFVVGGG